MPRTFAKTWVSGVSPASLAQGMFWRLVLSAFVQARGAAAREAKRGPLQVIHLVGTHGGQTRLDLRTYNNLTAATGIR
jgi:hypothetical protein